MNADIDRDAIERLKSEIRQNTDERTQLERQLNNLVKSEFQKTDREDKALNVGEWSEIYVFQRIMESGVLQAADCGDSGELVPIYDAFLPVLKVIREEFKDLGQFEYYTGNFENGTRALKIYYDGSSEPLLECTAEEFREKADSLYDSIKNRRNNVSCPDQIDFLEKIFVRKIKSPSRRISDSLGGKSDITLQTIQPDRMKTTAGFSIKSNVKSKPTLINSSEANDIIYRLDGCTDNIMDRVNAVDTTAWLRDRTRMLLHEPCINIRFERFSSDICNDNLRLISDTEPEVIALAVLYARDYPADGQRTNSRMKYVYGSLCKTDPLHIGRNAEIYYRKRLEDFLYAFACGMQADEPWNGRMQINGGYITVSKEGDLLVFCAGNQDSYKRWLFENTCFDTPSGGRHENIGTVRYDADSGKYLYSLPLQVRFTT